MNVAFKPEFEKFAVGQPVSRKEDPVLLRGEGRYSDDINLPGQLYAVFVRSRYAHGMLRGIDASEAAGMPGVRGVLTAADLEAGGIQPMPAAGGTNADGTPTAKPRQMALASSKVRYVGDPVAVVIAETAKQARDAAETVMLDIEALPAVTTARAAIQPGAPVLHDEVPGNAFLHYHHGDTAAVDAAFARAAHVTSLSIRNSRIVVAAMEPRSAVGVFDAGSERFTLRLGCQGVFGMRQMLKDVLGVPREKLHILTFNVGGSFGMKASVYPEYPCVLLASKRFGAPVKWTDERSDSFLSDSHGRDHETEASLALDADGKFLAVRLTVLGNLGAYLSNATTLPPTTNTTKNTISVYATPLIEVTSTCVFTNTTAVGAYRGAGRPEGNYYMERLIDTAAAEMGIDRIDLRRRNHIRPEQLPYKAPSGMNYDSGDFPALLERALEMADWDGFAARRAESRSRGKLRGRGVGQYLEVTAPPAPEMGGLRFEEDGTVTIITGTLDYGQGHATPFAQVLCDRLGVPFEKVRLLQGDSDQLIAGGGTGGSKSMMASGTAIVAASLLCIEKGRQAAAHLLEAAVADIEFERGRFTIAGTDRGIGIMEVAARLRDAPGLPDDVPHTLDVETTDEYANSAFPNGVHVAEVEVDAETGEAEVVSYNMANDFGVVINPKLVEGQAHGGVVQGIGQALLETTAYDDDGQLMTGSFMDYALPHAEHAPRMAVQSHPVPAKTNVLGVKGCGEAGCAGSLPAVMNALVDALRPLGVVHLDMPATPQKIWAAMQAA
ncbi:MAG: xanthine dehydrogenase family protein molybdopterin-binding subunit [Acetobacteraceae bacterium]|nr:xanthine dehydrogenase family protein molybdopterin-binding subunit [Acetobacteraceae bacterium]